MQQVIKFCEISMYGVGVLHLGSRQRSFGMHQMYTQICRNTKQGI